MNNLNTYFYQFYILIILFKSLNLIFNYFNLFINIYIYILAFIKLNLIIMSIYLMVTF